MVRCLRGRGSGRGRGRGREGSAGLACGVRQQRVEGERASWQGGLWGWLWVGAAVVAEVGEEVEAVVSRCMSRKFSQLVKARRGLIQPWTAVRQASVCEAVVKRMNSISHWSRSRKEKSMTTCQGSKGQV